MSVWQERRRPGPPQDDDARTPFDVDYARVIHSGSFRRLQGKTQILNLGDGDFYRTRLTHSLEVAQIAGGIVGQLQAFSTHPGREVLPPVCLIQTLGFAHDLGHPPFGHGGEVALNYCMRHHGGYEGNGQTLRILGRLENFSREHGANLTRRTLLGLLKYPVAYGDVVNPDIVPAIDITPTAIRVIDRKACKPPKAYLDSERDIVDWVLAPLSAGDRARFQSFDTKPGKHGKARHKAFDCSIMDVADDIAYGVHDLEDALSLGLIREQAFRDAVPDTVCTQFLNFLSEKHSQHYSNNVYEQFVRNLFESGQKRKMMINMIVGQFIKAAEITTDEAFEEPLLRYRVGLPDGHAVFLDALKTVVLNKVIRSPQVQQMEFKGQNMVVAVFEAYETDPQAYLPEDAYGRYVAAGEDRRVICDHIAGMTDGHLMKTYERMFSPRMGSVFDKL